MLLILLLLLLLLLLLILLLLLLLLFRPANIFWREVSAATCVSERNQDAKNSVLSGEVTSNSTCDDAASLSTVQVQLIDFEDAVPFGLLVKHAANYLRHRSYPDYYSNSNTHHHHHHHHGVTLTLLASRRHNDFFLRSISSWLRGSSQSITYDQYMFNVSPEMRNNFNGVVTDELEITTDRFEKASI